jgi:hypothetical protein
MVAINFSPEFAGPVVRGEKRQTIRRGRKCEPGTALQLYTSQRKLRDAVCREVIPITMTRGCLEVGGSVYMSDTATAFARADGFKNYDAMWAWFSARYKTNSFTGYVIWWE